MPGKAILKNGLSKNSVALTSLFNAAFIFKEEVSFEGKRLFLTKIKEHDDDLINKLMKQYHPDWY